MRSSPHAPRVLSLQEQLVVLDRQEHLAELTKVVTELSALDYRQRELVARVLSEGASWNEVAQATGVSLRTARRRWSAAPSVTNIGESARAAHAAEIRASSGLGRPNNAC